MGIHEILLLDIFIPIIFLLIVLMQLLQLLSISILDNRSFGLTLVF
jgi:hypothetical protein